LGHSDREPKVSVIILNYNRPEYTLDCVHSVLKSDYTNIEIVVVDNCSESSKFVFLQKKLAMLPVTIIQTGSNVGYSGGNNVGMLRSTGRYILILNDDVIIDKDSIRRLVDIAEKHSEVGIIGPLTYTYDSGNLWFYSPNLLQVDREIMDVSIVVGAAFLVRREAIEKTGLLDENYFMYHEEWDLCVRARAAGYRTVCALKIRVWHKVQEKNTYYAPHYAYFFNRNFFLFAAKHCKTTRKATSFLFKHIIWGDNNSSLFLYPLWALRNGNMKTFKAYFAGIANGLVLFFRLRLQS